MSPEARPIRVLVLLEQARPTGLVRQLIELLSRLPERGVKPRVVSILRRNVDARPLVDRLEARGVRVDVVREARPFDLAPVGAIRRIAEEWEPDVVQSHGYKTAAYARWVGHANLPWVAFYHGRTSTSWRVRLYHQFERWAIGAADIIAPVAPGVESHFRAIDRRRLRAVPNGVIELPGAREERVAVRARYGFEAEDVVVGFVGRLSHEKAPDRFLQTISLAGERRPDIVGLVVGDGPMRSAIVSAAARNGTTPRVQLAGHVTDMRDVYQALDGLLIPSRSEVFPNVLLEAVDCRVPVAAAPVGGIPGIGEGLASVVVATDGTAESLAEALLAALSISPDAREHSRDAMRSRYSQDRRAEEIVSIYRSVLRART